MPDGASLLTQGTRREEAVRALADYSDEDDKATLEILGHPFRDGLCEPFQMVTSVTLPRTLPLSKQQGRRTMDGPHTQLDLRLDITLDGWRACRLCHATRICLCVIRWMVKRFGPRSLGDELY